MYRAFSISALFLIHFLMIFLHVGAANDIIQDTCKKLVDYDSNVKFDFCVKSLGSDPTSHETDLEGLGLIGLKLLKANYTDTIGYIKQLLKQELEPHLLKKLRFCLDNYIIDESKDGIPDYKAKRYVEASLWVGGMMTSEDTCDTQASPEKGKIPPLTKRNDVISQLGSIGLSILDILQGKA